MTLEVMCVHVGMFMCIYVCVCVSKSPEGVGALNDTSTCADERKGVEKEKERHEKNGNTVGRKKKVKQGKEMKSRRGERKGSNNKEEECFFFFFFISL